MNRRHDRRSRCGTAQTLAWLTLLFGAALPVHAQSAAGDGEVDEIIASSPADLPERTRRHAAHAFKKLPDGYSMRVTLGYFFDHGHSASSNQREPYVASLQPLNPAGKADGVETLYEMRNPRPLRTITWKDGEKHGPEIIYIDGKPETEIPWVKGEIEGVRKTYYPDGSVRSETTYRDNEPHGASKSYAVDGALTRDAQMRNGKRHGTLTDYWSSTGKPRRVIEYREGRVQGVVREYYADGEIKREIPFQDDMMHGEEKEYEVDGSLRHSRFWIEGDRVGRAEFERRSKE